MNIHAASCVIVFALALSPPTLVSANDTSALRLIPFPKEVSLQAGSFRLECPLVVRAGPKTDQHVSQIILSELRRAGVEATAVIAPDLDDRTLEIRAGAVPEAVLAPPAKGDESYVLRVGPNGATVHGAGPAGLRHGAATLSQLIRANRGPAGLPCLVIRDWPSLRWRCFQDDMTRGPSTRPDTLKCEVDLGADLKLNLFTYYMEYQFAFKKHPNIGPKDGSFRPEELARWSRTASRWGSTSWATSSRSATSATSSRIPSYATLRETPTSSRR